MSHPKMARVGVTAGHQLTHGNRGRQEEVQVEHTRSGLLTWPIISLDRYEDELVAKSASAGAIWSSSAGIWR